MGDPYLGRPRHGHHEPITPTKDGQAPAWVVACLDCDWAADAHGLTSEDAVKAMTSVHQAGHRLVARSIDYSEGWQRPGQPLAGIPPSTVGHPLYHA